MKNFNIKISLYRKISSNVGDEGDNYYNYDKQAKRSKLGMRKSGFYGNVFFSQILGHAFQCLLRVALYEYVLLCYFLEICIHIDFFKY